MNLTPEQLNQFRIARDRLEKLIKKPSINLSSLCFDKQLAFINDPERFATAVTSRRAGKTTACALHLLSVALNNPDTTSFYITYARTDAKGIIWPMLHKLNRELKLEGEPNEADLVWKFKNGSVIRLGGAATPSEINRFRGYAIKLAYVDECFHPYTLIDTPNGDKKISELNIGDLVFNANGVGKITTISKKEIARSRRLFYNDKWVECSDNHPFLTATGWKEASELKIGDSLVSQNFCVRILQEGISKTKQSEPSLSFLQSLLLSEKDSSNTESNVESSNEIKSKCDITAHRTQTDYQERKWSWTYRARKGFITVFTKCKMELRYFFRQRSKIQWISNKLQSGYCYTRNKISHRSGWSESFFIKKKRDGQKKGKEVNFFRLERVEILKPESTTTNQGSYFYDIGVSGHPSFSVNGALVHNCQRFGNYLESLIDDVLIPGCIDKKGAIRLIGTPPRVPVGYFHDCAKLPHNHHWTIFDNPWVPDAQGELDRELKRRGVSIDDPTIQREFFGRFTVDDDCLVLHYNKSLNDYIDLPTDTYNHIMGIDLGFKDADAICILGHSANSPVTYIVDELVTTKQGLTELFSQVEFLRNKYNCYKLVIDTGGLGLKIAEEMRRRWRIPVHAADKKRKYENLEILNDALRTSRFRAKTTSRFANDSMLLEWDMDKLKPDRRVISERFHSDIIDAALYAFKESPAFTYITPKPQPKYGSAEWSQEETSKMYEQALKHYQEQEDQKKEVSWL